MKVEKGNSKEDIERVSSICERTFSSMDSALVGQKDAKRVITSSMLCNTNSRILLIGDTGMGKTTISNFLASSFNSERIQITSDMIPSDIQNHLKTKSDMDFLQIEELNRASGKVQSAFIELLEENQMTIEGEKRSFGDFYVLASQNAQDISGVFNVPQAVYDRFNVSINFGKLTEDEKRKIFFGGFTPAKKSSISKEDIRFTKLAVDKFKTDKNDEDVMMQIFSLIDSIKFDGKDLFAGDNIRAHLFALKLVKLAALASGREYILPSDIIGFIDNLYMHRVNQNVAKMDDDNVKSLLEDAKSKILKIKRKR